MKKQISVKDLITHVSKIDYADSNTFPVVFDVINDDEIIRYEAGICPAFIDGEYTEGQYFIQGDDDYTIIDVDDPDNMTFGDIEAMIYNCCDIMEDSIVRIHEDENFTGIMNDVMIINCIDENGETYLDDEEDIKDYNWIDWQIKHNT